MKYGFQLLKNYDLAMKFLITNEAKTYSKYRFGFFNQNPKCGTARHKCPHNLRHSMSWGTHSLGRPIWHHQPALVS